MTMKTAPKIIVSRNKTYHLFGLSPTRTRAQAEACALSGKAIVRKIGDAYGWAWAIYLEKEGK